MPEVKVGTGWKTKGGTLLPSELRPTVTAAGTNPTVATALPQQYDLVRLFSASDTVDVGKVQILNSREASAAATALSTTPLYGVCVQSPGDGKLNNPGYTAGTLGSPNVAAFGGVGSRSTTMNPANQRYCVRIKPDDELLMGVCGEGTSSAAGFDSTYNTDTAGYTAAATTINVSATPADFDTGAMHKHIWVPSTGEIMVVTNITTTALTVVRGACGTTAAAIPAAATALYLVAVPGMHYAIKRLAAGRYGVNAGLNQLQDTSNGFAAFVRGWYEPDVRNGLLLSPRVWVTFKHTVAG